MDETSVGTWGALASASPSPYAAQGQSISPYGASVQPSALNGYPMFSSQTSTSYSPSGYANGNPVDSTPSVIANQARAPMQAPMPQAPAQQAQPAPFNPWNIKTSSPIGAFDYPMGQSQSPPKIAEL